MKEIKSPPSSITDAFFAYIPLLALIAPFAGVLFLFILSHLTPWSRRRLHYFTSATKRVLYQPTAREGNSLQAEDYDPSSEQLFPALLELADEEKERVEGRDGNEVEELAKPKRTPPSLYLTVVVPCKNEAKRLPNMLDECLEYLERRMKQKQFSYEVIVVDDGSSDATADVAFSYVKRYPQLRVLQLSRNMGKGGAVREGVLCSRGQLIMFADGDGATNFADFALLEREMWMLCNGDTKGMPPSGEVAEEELMAKGTTTASLPSLDWTHPGVVVGSRAHLVHSPKVKRSLMRNFLMHGFHTMVRVLAVHGVRDTQCGFKLFTRAAAAQLFPRIHLERWAFDVELLYLAEQLRYSLREVAVEWNEVDGSQLVPVLSWAQMGRDILLLWFRYCVSGQWRLNDYLRADY